MDIKGILSLKVFITLLQLLILASNKLLTEGRVDTNNATEFIKLTNVPRNLNRTVKYGGNDANAHGPYSDDFRDLKYDRSRRVTRSLRKSYNNGTEMTHAGKSSRRATNRKKLKGMMNIPNDMFAAREDGRVPSFPEWGHTDERLTENSMVDGVEMKVRKGEEGGGKWWQRISSMERWSRIRRMAEDVGLDVRKEERSGTKGVLGRIYGSLFAMTHARLHPGHHRPVRVLVVDQNGLGNSRTIQGAIDMVRVDNKYRIQIMIRPGVYREKVYVPYRKPFITFQGSGSENTIITWNSRAGDKNEEGEMLGTFASASVAIDSDYFVARDITFQNTSPPPLPGAVGMQAVALRISGDKAAFLDCRMLGSQDTLFDHVGRHFFLRCYIEGAIDFIFGDGRSLYLNCELHANAATYGAIAASQRTSGNDNTGFSFVQCKITGTGLLYLGRAWGQYARIIFAFCYFDNIIIPDGWYDWGDTSRRETVFFGEYRCWGPGAQPRWRASWSKQLAFQDVRPFLSLGYINGHKWFNILT